MRGARLRKLVRSHTRTMAEFEEMTRGNAVGTNQHNEAPRSTSTLAVSDDRTYAPVVCAPNSPRCMRVC
jgi:hypothetical protein